MEFTITVPDIVPANFTRPSLELLRFIEQLQALCVYLSKQYRTIDGEELFSGYIRNGSDSVFCVNDGTTAPIDHYDERKVDEADRGDIEYPYEMDEGTSSEGEQCVVMDKDRPGKWVVARFHVRGWRGFTVLYSSDFEPSKGRPAKAIRLLGRIGRHLAKCSHKVPGAKA